MSERFKASVLIARPVEEVFDWHERPGAFERLVPPWTRVEVLRRSGGIHDGGEVELRSRLGPIWMNWQVRHRDYQRPVLFRDVALRSPFARWEHAHRFERISPTTTRLTDEIEYQLPGGAAGRRLGGGKAHRELRRLFAYRHEVTKADVERTPIRARGRVIVAGASGTIGRALVPFLTTQGYDVRQLVRREPRDATEIAWDPANERLDLSAIGEIEAVVNLAGANVAEGRWTEDRKAEIIRSRERTTRTLIAAMGRLARRPRLFISASAIGFYGNTGSQCVDESAPLGNGFLAHVCETWEREATRAETLGVKSVRLRFGVVLTPAGGALAKMLPLYRAGLGGVLGHRDAWFSWIGIEDLLAGVGWVLEHDSPPSLLNFVSPEPVTQADLAMHLGWVLRRPAVLPAPAFALKLAFGQMADEALLSSQRVMPAALLHSGFRFRQPLLVQALRHMLGDSISTPDS